MKSRPEYWIKDDAGNLWQPGMEPDKHYFSGQYYPAFHWVDKDKKTAKEITVRGHVLPASVVVWIWDLEEGFQGILDTHHHRGTFQPG